ncbi:hypothetical protein [Solidesulfovibrio alcoholivorans]|uniref:hypothetical protein n=1 Tax=Solidesulfovibrio alcoholivorans TaxID=81406 RepID=UPI000495A72E|nr:hypothetical protein [Solidesulfovibrio alcoholivorans]
MATTITSPNTNDVVNWAYKYSLACGKLTAAENAASSSATRRKDIATAKADFNATMKSLVPTDAQTSVQFQYMDALTQYNTNMASATTEKGRQAAMTTLYSTLEGITMPSATSTTLADLATANQTAVSNAAANIKSMVSNAGSAWLSAVASGANILNTQASSITESIKTALAQVGADTSNITTPTITTTASSAFAAASASATTGGSAGSILSAALIGYLVAEQAGGG